MKFDFKQIAEGACAFYNVGILYLEPEKNVLGVAAIPYYVDTAFACELFMKAIIAFHNPDITKKDFQNIGHRLDKLFEVLPTEIKNTIKGNIPDYEIQKRQTDIISQYKKLLRSDASDEAKSIAKHQIENSISSFAEMLTNQATLFEDWRYYYESNDGVPIFCEEWFLYQFCNELHNIMAKIMNSR